MSEVSTLNSKIQQLILLCDFNLHSAEDSKKHKTRKALKCFKNILSQSSSEEIKSSSELPELIKCSLNLMQFHVQRRRNIFVKNLFSSLIKILIPDNIDLVIGAIMKFLDDKNLWKFNFICCEIFNSILSCGIPPEVILDQLLDNIDQIIRSNNLRKLHNVVDVLDSTVDNEKFKSLPSVGVQRLLQLYYLSVTVKDENYSLIQAGLEKAIKTMLSVIHTTEVMNLLPNILHLTFNSSLSDIECREFGWNLRQGVSRLQLNQITKDLLPETLAFLLSSMQSTRAIESYLATQYLVVLIDEYNNCEHFSSPEVFYVSTNYEISLGLKSEIGDTRKIIENYRDLFETSIISATKLHISEGDISNAIYSLLCVILVTIPCGFSVTFIVCILMNLQRHALAANRYLCLDDLHRLHAMIASIMTLICWVTRAKTFTKYIQEVVNLRYNLAPQLNPRQHNFHHNIFQCENEYKPNLYFDLWELRYSLWKRFRLDEKLLKDVKKTFSGFTNKHQKKKILRKLLGKSEEKFYKISPIKK
ncbi:CLUMA_CG019932, isoform A [Clunio marinus]|uniref:CLUMA_CG019932, isoform A n=1 Tax=Clunio marinus TaxID=568069 RepID=A0A1J1J2N4_9DIPT|nr:CLUMA_CG019932, isoform A [Clunio marinus]